MAWEEVQACGQFRIKELGGSTGEPAAPRALPRAGGSPLWLWAASIHSLYCEQALVLEVDPANAKALARKRVCEQAVMAEG